MSLQCGIVGLPNVGKSTLFNALTRAGIQAENYPFCTIEPNVGIVEVPDPRLAALAEIVHPQRIQSAIVEFVDIAGLVAGASKGEGLGNQFLANIRETNAIVHVVRCFEDSNVVHVSGSVDPIRDIEVIDTELALADLASVEKALARYSKQARAGGDKEAKVIVAVLDIFNWLLKNGCKLKAEAETTESKYLEYGDTKIRISRHFPNSMSANSIYVMIPVNNKHSFGLFIGKQYCAISDIRELKTVLKALFVVLDIKAFGELSKISLEEQRVKFNIDTISLKEKEIERKKEEIKLLKEQIEVLKEKVKNQASTLTILQKKK